MGAAIKCWNVFSKIFVLYITIVLATIPTLPGTVKAQDDPAEKELSNIQKLSDKIFHGYDANTRPVKHHTNTTIVYFNFIPIYIVDVVEDLSMLQLDGWLFLAWDDHRLSWNPEEYDGLNHIQIRDHFIWQPDITVYNAHSGMIDPKVNTHLLLYSSGRVIFVPPAVLDTICPINLQGSYPKDKLSCLIQFGSWSHDGWQVDLQLDREKMYMDEFENSNPRWEMLVDEATILREQRFYNCCAEPYVSIKVNLPMQRRPPPELQVIWAPCVLVMVLTLSMFWIPPSSSKKLLLGGFLFTALCILIVYIAFVTKSPTSVKRAVTFLESTMYALTSAIVLEVLVINLGAISGPCRPPEILVSILTSPLAKFGAVFAPWETNIPGDKIQLKDDDNQQLIYHPTPNNEWLLVATGLDRVLFFVYIIILAAIHQI